MEEIIEKGYVTVSEDLFLKENMVTCVWRKGKQYSYEIDNTNIKIWSDLVEENDGRWNYWLKSSKHKLDTHMTFTKESK